MKINTWIILFGVMVFAFGCKSDQDKQEAKKEIPEVGVDKPATSSPKQFEVRHVGDKDPGNAKMPNDAERRAKQLETKKAETKKAARNTKKGNAKKGNKVVDVEFPSTMRLVSIESIEKAFGIEQNRLINKSKNHNKDSGISKSVWSWNTRTGESNKLNIILSRNPSPENYLDWSTATLDQYINKGLSISDGSKMTFEEIKLGGQRYAWNAERKMLKWFHDEYFSINLTGFGDEFTKDNILNLAKSINAKITQYKK